jgi:hypothetical protein
MKRRSEHLVEKRDGRTEFLRATKLARSIHTALHSVGVDEGWRALEVTATVLAGLRHRRGAFEAEGGAPGPLTTAEIADAVQSVLVATGQAAAAVAFGAIAAERGRRRSSAGGGRGLGLEGPVPRGLGAAVRRDPQE